MLQVLKILLATLFTGATAASLGFLLLQRLRLEFPGLEHRLYAFITGSALLSLLVFGLTAGGMANTWAFAALGGLAIAACGFKRAYRVSATGINQPTLPPFWRVLFIVSFIGYGSLYLMNALAPEISPDGSAYHLGLVAQYLRQHGFGRITTNMYANLTMGIEMLFLFAFAFGRHSAAAMVHFLFYLALPLLMLAFGKRAGVPAAGAAAGLLVMLSPVVGIDGSSAYIDVGMACILFALFCLLRTWDVQRNRALIIPIGLLAGFAYAAKLTAFIAVPYAVLFVAWKLWKSRQDFWRPMAMLVFCIALMIGPWVLKNAIIVGNPFSPFLNRYFPNPYVHISFEEIYSARLRNYDHIQSPLEIPLEAAVKGGTLQGILGPVFLLLPLGLFAVRTPLGRQLFLAGLVFSASYAGNIGTRFLIGGLPFLSFALALALANWRGMLSTVVIFHAIISWPSSVRLYCDPYAWRVDKFLWKPAFRVEKEEDYLASRSGGYLAAKLIEKHVPPDGKVFAFTGPAEAYCRRNLLIAYQAGFNNMVGDLLATGMIRDYQPIRAWKFAFPQQLLFGVRLVQTAVAPKGELWSVAELRVLEASGEVPRTGKWQLRASPNPWEVQMVFDNCPISRWSSWERARPGMMIEARFGEPKAVASVEVDLAPIQPSVSARLEGEVQPGHWVVLAAAPIVSEKPPPPSSRKKAIDDLKRLGITHLNVNAGDFLASDTRQNSESWGITLLGEVAGNRLYKLD